MLMLLSPIIRASAMPSDAAAMLLIAIHAAVLMPAPAQRRC